MGVVGFDFRASVSGGEAKPGWAGVGAQMRGKRSSNRTLWQGFCFLMCQRVKVAATEIIKPWGERRGHLRRVADGG